MAKIKGIWIFNETIDIDSLNINSNNRLMINFISNDTEHTYLYEGSDYDSGVPTLVYSNQKGMCVYHSVGGHDSNGVKGWLEEAYRTVDFGSTEQEVSDEFLTWIQANAAQKQVSGVIITYKETTISLESGKTVTLTTANKKLTGDIAITSPERDVLEEWDGSYTMKSSNLISFTIDGDHYEAEDGMTWGEWVDSEYNTLEAYITDGGTIGVPSGGIELEDAIVYDTDLIIAGVSYSVEHAGGSN